MMLRAADNARLGFAIGPQAASRQASRLLTGGGEGCVEGSSRRQAGDGWIDEGWVGGV